MDSKSEFIEIYKKYITRPGADKLLAFLTSEHSDFFSAPASTKFHGDHEGGLCEHSLNVYHNLVDYLSRERVQEVYGMKYSDESIAICGLLHDICKVNCYKVEMRNTKDENGKWVQVPYYQFEDSMPFGHGEKSVYMIMSYMRLKREEAFAIRYHMGFSGNEDARNVGASFEMFPLSFALAVADMEATYYLEAKK